MTTPLEFTKSQRAVENREKWREQVAKSSVVPQRPSRLRGRRERETEDNKVLHLACVNIWKTNQAERDNASCFGNRGRERCHVHFLLIQDRVKRTEL